MDRTPQPPYLQLAPTASCPGTSPPFLRMYERVVSVTTPRYERDQPCYEHRALFMSVTPLLRACGTWLLQIMHVQCLLSYGFPSNKISMVLIVINATLYMWQEGTAQYRNELHSPHQVGKDSQQFLLQVLEGGES